ncbi:peptidase U32 family protein [Thermodesulfobacteriota bacterium]
MKILSPLDSTDEVAQLAEAGAGEFFCGVLEDAWYERYPVISINRRPAGKGHFRKFSDLRAAVASAHALDLPVYFTINEHYYINEQYPLIRRYVESALEAGVDAFIVSDFGLMAYIREQGYEIPLHISTGGVVLNWRTAAFYCREFSVENITFPRHLSLAEIGAVAEKLPGIDTTVFVLNSRCINIDGLCTFQHGLAGKKIFPMFRNACMLPYEVSVFCSDENASPISFNEQATILERQKIWETVHVDDHPCGACGLSELHAMGVGSIKIVGRGNPIERKVMDVAFFKALLDYFENNPTAEQHEFRQFARTLYDETYKRACRRHMCYFPEVLA